MPGTASMPTHCPYCALQCAMSLTPKSDGTSVTVEGRDFPTNRGALCQKGWTAAELLNHPSRLTAPLVREVRGDRKSRLIPVDWETALDLIAAEVAAIQKADGRDAIAVFGGGGLTNEKAYALGKFARVALGTSQIDYNGRFCMSSAAAASNASLGLDRGMPFPLTDVQGAGAVLLIGSNIAETMPPAMQHFEIMRASGGRLIVIDPRITRTALNADLHLQPAPGTDLAVAMGLLHILCAQGAIDEQYIAERTTGFDQVRASVQSYRPDYVERITGVPSALLQRAATWLAEQAPFRQGRGSMILTGRGGEQHSNGTQTVHGFINVALALGLPGGSNSGYGCVTGQGNGQGGREHGQKADQLPGYRMITDPAAREHVAGVWGVEPDSIPGPGRSAFELLDALGQPDGPRALLVMGSNPVVSAPSATRITERIESLDLLVVADFFMSETAALADVVLPVTQWAEETGTMTNLEGRVILRQQAVTPPVGVRSDLQVLSELAQRLGAGQRFPADAFPTEPQVVFAELGRASAGGRADYSEVTYERILQEGGVLWGGDRMFAQAFPTADGRARFVGTSFTGVAEPTDNSYPMTLTTGRVLAQYQSGTQTRRVSSLVEASGEPFVEVHPDVAADLGIGAGDHARVTTRRGSVSVSVRISAALRPDTIFMPFHWAGAGRANTLTIDTLDPTSKMPEFKACAARIERAEPQL
ncbi:MAG: molybdopterin oxidoreductase family protein [Actinomycetota bacterium]|nr:molybdopterin oxidoreductase family protein [Actinomycetota bacterium]